MSGNEGRNGIGWREPAIVLGVLAVLVAVAALARDVFDLRWPSSGSAVVTTAPLTTGPTASRTPAPSPAISRRQFAAAANAACLRRGQRNAVVAQQVGHRPGGSDFASEMRFVAGSLTSTDQLIAELAALDRPSADDQRIEDLIGHLAEANVMAASALDVYQRFGPENAEFLRQLGDAAAHERKFNAAAKALGALQCG